MKSRYDNGIYKNDFAKCVNINAGFKDINRHLVHYYISKINSPLFNKKLEYKDLLKELQVVDEQYNPLNIGLMMFSHNPEVFVPSCYIRMICKIMKQEVSFKGPVDYQFSRILSYISNCVLAVKIYKIPGQAEALRIKNYNYDVLKELVASSICFNDYKVEEPITILVEEDEIIITYHSYVFNNCDVDDSISEMSTYANTMIGKYLKELDLIDRKSYFLDKCIKDSSLPKFVVNCSDGLIKIIILIDDNFLNYSQKNN